MRRRILVFVGAIWCLAGTTDALAQNPPMRPDRPTDGGVGPKPAPRPGPVFVLKSNSMAAYDQALDGLRQVFTGRLRILDLGGDARRGKALAQRIARALPAAVVAIGAKAARVARDFLPGIPLVYCLVLHPKRFRLAAAGGVPLAIPAHQQLAVLRQLAPRARRIGILIGSDVPRSLRLQAPAAVRALRLPVVTAEVTAPRQLTRALESLLPRVDALWLLPASDLIRPASLRFLLLRSFRRGLPVLGFARSLVRAGALVALTPDYERMGRRTARLLVQILAGGAASQVDAPEPRITINATTARRLGLAIPASLRARASIVR